MKRLRKLLCRLGRHLWKDVRWFSDPRTDYADGAALIGQECRHCLARRQVARPSRFRIPTPYSLANAWANRWVGQG